MISEMILSTECFVTDIAGVWSLVSMRAFVDEKIVRLCEMSAAILADELLLGPGRSSPSPPLCGDPSPDFPGDGLLEVRAARLHGGFHQIVEVKLGCRFV